MTQQTISDIRATQDLIKTVQDRIDKHAEDFMKDDALSNLTLAQKHLEDASRLLGQAGTVEDLPLVLRTSLRMVKEAR